MLSYGHKYKNQRGGDLIYMTNDENVESLLKLEHLRNTFNFGVIDEHAKVTFKRP